MHSSTTRGKQAASAAPPPLSASGSSKGHWSENAMSAGYPAGSCTCFAVRRCHVLAVVAPNLPVHA